MSIEKQDLNILLLILIPGLLILILIETYNYWENKQEYKK